MIINLTKTNYIVFHTNYCNNKDILNNVTLSIESVPMNKVNTVNFLGVHIQSNMSWDVHITNVSNKVSKCIGILYKLKHVLPQSTLLLLYNTFLYPYLNYCIIVWGNHNKTRMDLLHKLQKKALRICTGSHYLSHSAPIFKELNTLNIFDIYTYNIAILGFYFFKNMLPHNISAMFCTNDTVHNYDTRNSNNLHMYVVKSNLIKNSIRHQFPVIWYTIPTEIRSYNSLARFKRELKKYLVTKY